MTTVEEIVHLMKTARIAPGRIDSLNPDLPLNEQGLDSFDRMSLLTELEDRFHVDLPNEIVRQLKSLNDIVRYLNQQP